MCSGVGVQEIMLCTTTRGDLEILYHEDRRSGLFHALRRQRALSAPARPTLGRSLRCGLREPSHLRASVSGARGPPLGRPRTLLPVRSPPPACTYSTPPPSRCFGPPPPLTARQVIPLAAATSCQPMLHRHPRYSCTPGQAEPSSAAAVSGPRPLHRQGLMSRPLDLEASTTIFPRRHLGSQRDLHTTSLPR